MDDSRTRELMAMAARQNVAVADQIDATFSEVLRLAPENRGKVEPNSRLDSAIRMILSVRDQHRSEGPVPIVRLHETHPREGSHEYDHVDGLAIPQSAVVAYCNLCMDSGRNVPFWYPCGAVIVQIDMCIECATYYIVELGHKERKRW